MQHKRSNNKQLSIMKKTVILLLMLTVAAFSANAQSRVDWNKVGSAAAKGVQAFTISDAELIAYIQEYVDWVDANNPVCSVNDTDPGMRATAERMERIAAKIPFKEINGRTLDIKALYVEDVNAFACANGSIRVFAGLMEIMTDDEILAVMGHEVGHIANEDTKDAFKQALLNSALKDAISSTGGTVAKLSDSQLGELGEALASAQFSQKQELEADDYGYEFLKKCGVDPSNMASSLKVLKSLEGGTDGGSNSFAKALTSGVNQIFSSHPPTDKRIKNLEKKK